MILPLDIETLAWGHELAEYRLVRAEGVKAANGRLLIDPGLLEELSREALHDVGHFLPAGQLEAYAAIARDPASSENDRWAALALLKNAAIAAEGVLPLCQDTGTAWALAFRGEDVETGGGDALALARGAVAAYAAGNFRRSQVAPVSMFDEADSGDNSPAQAEVLFSARPGYRILFGAKGGGSANKTRLHQGTKALLAPGPFRSFVREAVNSLGTAACPPNHGSMVGGGPSPEQNLRALKLSTAGFLGGWDRGEVAAMGALRSPEWEAEIMEAARATGLGAQFGGKALALGAEAIRLPRHAASCPVSIGVSCNAHRGARALVAREGAFLERLERDPGRFLSGLPASALEASARRIDLGSPMTEALESLRKARAGDMVLLSGPVIVARDAAHARLKALRDEGKPFPPWFAGRAVMYAGPAGRPEGRPSGSFGPTTAGRMDDYVPSFMEAGASLVMIAKGNRSEAVRAACARFGGCYLGVLGGAAALIADRHVLDERVVDYAELGMEAARLVTLRDLPAFVVIDATGADLYAPRKRGQ